MPRTRQYDPKPGDRSGCRRQGAAEVLRRLSRRAHRCGPRHRPSRPVPRRGRGGEWTSPLEVEGLLTNPSTPDRAPGRGVGAGRYGAVTAGLRLGFGCELNLEPETTMT